MNPFSDNLKATLGKYAAFFIMLVILCSAVLACIIIYRNYTVKINTTRQAAIAAASTLNLKPEYKPGKAVSATKPNEMKENNEKLSSFISNNDAIIAEFYR